MSALTQAIEAHWARHSPPISEMYALAAVKLVVNNLDEAGTGGGSARCRPIRHRAPGRLQEVPYWVEVLCSEFSTWSQRIRELRAGWVYSVGSTGVVGASYLAKLSSAGVHSAEGN